MQMDRSMCLIQTPENTVVFSLDAYRPKEKDNGMTTMIYTEINLFIHDEKHLYIRTCM